MQNYNWNYPTTMWVGENRIKDLGSACKKLNINKPLLVTDNGLANNKIVLNAVSLLKKANLILWDLEDKLRAAEKNKKFNENFISLARSVYINNDNRAKIKLKIVSKYINLKLFFMNIPNIKSDIIIMDKNNSGNINIIDCI